MRSVLLASFLLVTGLAFFGGCDNKSVTMPSKTVVAPTEPGTGPPHAEDEKKDAEGKGGKK
jgi:hypothetical protein